MEYSNYRFFYGTEKHTIEVTHIIQQQCINEFGHVELLHPMNTLFGDPCPFIPKKLFCKSQDGTVQHIINEGQTAFPKYRLACCARIDDDSSSYMKEWLDHYIREGVERFYLVHHGINNEIFRPYIQQDLVRIFTKHDSVLSVAQKETEWLLCCDLNEFIYSRRSFPKTVDYLKTLSQDESCAPIPLKIFGPSACTTDVIQNHSYRKLYDETDKLTVRIYRTRCIRSLHPTMEGYCLQTVSENTLDNFVLHLNHYSREHLSNTILDDELKNKSY